MTPRARAVAFALLLGAAGIPSRGGTAPPVPPSLGVTPPSVEPAVADLWNRMRSAWAGTSALEGRFKQQSSGMAFPQPHVQSGTVRIERPARMRWDYEHPTRRSYRTDGTTLWIVDELDRTCTVVEPLDPSFARMVAFLSGHGELERDYKVSAVPAEGALGPGLRLLPRAEADGFREILLRLDPGTGLVSTVRTESSFGDVTETVLEGLRVVPDLPDDVFTWDSPPGYRLIRAQ